MESVAAVVRKSLEVYRWFLGKGTRSSLGSEAPI
jgi:hypothetical protein